MDKENLKYKTFDYSLSPWAHVSQGKTLTFGRSTTLNRRVLSVTMTRDGLCTY